VLLSLFPGRNNWRKERLEGRRGEERKRGGGGELVLLVIFELSFLYIVYVRLECRRTRESFEKRRREKKKRRRRRVNHGHPIASFRLPFLLLRGIKEEGRGMKKRGTGSSIFANNRTSSV